MGIRFYPYNLWKLYDTTPSTENVLFPASNTENRFPDEVWQSNSGAGSGGGRFIIVANDNDRLDFYDDSSILKTAILNPGTYTAATLEDHIQTQMQAVVVSGVDITVEFLTCGANQYHWRISSNGVWFELPWLTGTNTARSVGPSLGYAVVDDTGALTYTSEYVAIHTSEQLDKDFTDPEDINGFMIKHHNFQIGSILRFLASNAADFSTGIDVTITVPSSDLIQRIWDAAQTYRYTRVVIADPTNPAGYVEIGNICVSVHVAPTRNYSPRNSRGLKDLSLIMVSTGGQKRSVQLPRVESGPSYLFEGTPDRAIFDAMIDEVGYSKELYYVEKSSSPADTVRMVEIKKYNASNVAGGTFHNIQLVLEELV